MGDDASTDVFELVSHATRADILRALADFHRDAGVDARLAYNDLRRRVGERDSGNFTYHLDRLGGLVERGDGGYRLSRVGMRVVSTLRSGFLDADWTWGPVDAPGDCWTCGDDLRLRYEAGALHVTCGDDDHALALYVPPSFLRSQPRDAVAERAAFLENRWGSLTREGVCSECSGRVEGGLRLWDGDPEHWVYHGDCHHCGFQHVLPVGLFLLGHPDVLAFHFDHGVDVRTVPFWTLDFCEPGTETVVSTDPLRVRVDVEAGDETLSLTVDSDGDVIDAERA
ncbi:winged helix-turn-helix domain-containing protein [Halobacterium litoreum]|uniref:Winged helix-turn-helix domain-containing protein n=1 Tax=Halobacterium litoreum TaxID=2039234 RepID=A0ABD5NCF3_9EURY|nr:helix-turn-helix domain-containing protein [Halobacterium litoreum]UHH14148.1 helix-turn-helix domain-containing protein [Halobacterium litoreum]